MGVKRVEKPDFGSVVVSDDHKVPHVLRFQIQTQHIRVQTTLAGFPSVPNQFSLGEIHQWKMVLNDPFRYEAL